MRDRLRISHRGKALRLGVLCGGLLMQAVMPAGAQTIDVPVTGLVGLLPLVGGLGSFTVDPSTLSGFGTVGSPLGVNVNPTGGLVSTVNGIAINPATLNTLLTNGGGLGFSALNQASLLSGLNGIGGATTGLGFSALNQGSVVSGLLGANGFQGANQLGIANINLNSLLGTTNQTGNLVQILNNNALLTAGALNINTGSGSLVSALNSTGSLTANALNLPNVAAGLVNNGGLVNVLNNTGGLTVGALNLGTGTGGLLNNVNGLLSSNNLNNISAALINNPGGFVGANLLTGNNIALGNLLTTTGANNAVNVNVSNLLTQGLINNGVVDNRITTQNIADSAVTTAQIANNAVTWDKLAPGVRDRIDRNTEGVAVATAIVNPDLVAGERFGVTAHYGNFDGKGAVGFGAEGVIGTNVFGSGDRVAIMGGFGLGTDRGTAAGRIGAQLSW